MEFPKVQGETEPRHIGDGVYVTFDGWQIWLRTPRENGWHEIALEPVVIANLLDYMEQLKASVSS